MDMEGEGIKSGEPKRKPRDSQVVCQVGPKPEEGVGNQAGEALPGVSHAGV